MGVASLVRYAAAAALVLSWPASADTVGTGNEFLLTCGPEETSDIKKAFCVGYIRGIIEGTYTNTNAGERRWCLPEGVDLPQLRDVALDYIRTHPITRNQPAAFQIDYAFERAFPCPKK